MKKVCKICLKEKAWIYFCLDGRGYTVYKDEDGFIWHNRRCYQCHKERVRSDYYKKKILKL